MPSGGTLAARREAADLTTIRPAAAGDARRIGEIHVHAWQAAYRGGLLPQTYLDALSVDDRAQRWSDVLARPARPGEALLVAADGDGRVVGFLGLGPAADDANGLTGEIRVLHVDPTAWGRGYGGALLERATRSLARDGRTGSVLWVHPGNDRARAFYAAGGWRPDGAERVVEVLGVEVPEIRYRRSLADT